MAAAAATILKNLFKNLLILATACPIFAKFGKMMQNGSFDRPDS